MRYFLDMNIPIYFCMETGDILETKTKLFVKNKEEHLFLLCDYILSINLPKWLKRQKIILFEFNQKVQNQDYPSFSSEQSKSLFQQDKMFVNKLIIVYNQSQEKKQFVENINQTFNILQARINYFIRKYINEIVIPESEIDFELKSCLFDWLAPNDSDARTIASAIQEHNNKNLIIITADKKHWTEDLLTEINNDLKLKKRYPSLPKIEYIQDYNLE